MSKHYVGEAGTELIFDTGVLIGSATEYFIKTKSPAGVEGTFAADLYGSYSELAALSGTYLLKHTLAQTDFNTPGEWRLHAFVAAIGGTWHGELVKLTIYDIFQ